jgi:hypothetical protein
MFCASKLMFFQCHFFSHHGNEWILCLKKKNCILINLIIVDPIHANLVSKVVFLEE